MLFKKFDEKMIRDLLGRLPVQVGAGSAEEPVVEIEAADEEGELDVVEIPVGLLWESRRLAREVLPGSFRRKAWCL